VTQPAISAVGQRLSEQLEQLIMRRLEEDKLVVVPMPAVATKVLDAIHKNDCTTKHLADLLETDPILAARVLRVANSVRFAAAQPATNIQTAVSRIGLKNLSTVIVEATVSTLFESRDRRIADAAREVWQHSVAVALLARDIAVACGATDADDAYLAGLLHDVGKPILAGLMLEAEKQITQRSTKPWLGSDDWVQIIQRSHRKVGVLLCKKWEMPPAIVRAVEDCVDYDAKDPKSTANIVRLANGIAKQQGIYEGPVEQEDVDALITTGRSLLSVDDEAMERLSSGLREKAQVRLK
jgi:putative nucleotidyltransferase with HDIG domain